MARLYAASDILLHTAHWEPLANVLLEAMAAGLPVVATDIDGTREAVSPDCGALFPAGDVEAGRAALAPLLADDDRRRAMGRSAAERVRREFSPARQLPTFAALFREVAGGSAVGAGADPAGEGAAEPGRPGRAPIEDAIR
jgi:glycosyltransferase involved in cell wall biosynthesis